MTVVNLALRSAGGVYSCPPYRKIYIYGSELALILLLRCLDDYLTVAGLDMPHMLRSTTTEEDDSVTRAEVQVKVPREKSQLNERRKDC